ncbi:hypothetical protein NVIRENTERO_02552 [Sodalis praecaptivus]|nr:hypothetical protein NVIRENTERO_02552 [Sodalis praecaptivus]
MSTLALSLLQQPLVWMDGEANLAHFDRLLAPIDDQDLIVLPEMFTTGFAMEAAGNALSETRVVAWLAQWAHRRDGRRQRGHRHPGWRGESFLTGAARRRDVPL